jgi:hypothetical protein
MSEHATVNFTDYNQHFLNRAVIPANISAIYGQAVRYSQHLYQSTTQLRCTPEIMSGVHGQVVRLSSTPFTQHLLARQYHR